MPPRCTSPPASISPMRAKPMVKPSYGTTAPRGHILMGHFWGGQWGWLPPLTSPRITRRTQSTSCFLLPRSNTHYRCGLPTGRGTHAHKKKNKLKQNDNNKKKRDREKRRREGGKKKRRKAERKIKGLETLSSKVGRWMRSHG